MSKILFEIHFKQQFDLLIDKQRPNHNIAFTDKSDKIIACLSFFVEYQSRTVKMHRYTLSIAIEKLFLIQIVG